MKGEKEMKQYTKPEFDFIELFEDVLTLSNNGILLENGEDSIIFYWNNL